MLFTQGRLLMKSCTCLPVSACILAVSTVRSVLALGLLEVTCSPLCSELVLLHFACG